MCNTANIFLGLESQQFVAVVVVSGVYQWSLVCFFAKFCTKATSDSKRASVSNGFYVYTCVDESHLQ
jgi:hypothetical protein